MWIPVVPIQFSRYRFDFTLQDFSVETKDYVMIKKRMIFSSAKPQDLSKKEIELYYRMPKEMWTVGPVLLISALPFANYVVFPIAYETTITNYLLYLSIY